uniref:Uncharacterized protein n=1 Tax=Arundo donax TaxID=35708 RepID=A0A0A8Y7M6_ARUDO
MLEGLYNKMYYMLAAIDLFEQYYR